MSYVMLAAVNDGLSCAMMPISGARDEADAVRIAREWLAAWQHDFTQAVVVTDFESWSWANVPVVTIRSYVLELAPRKNHLIDADAWPCCGVSREDHCQC